MHPRRVTEAVSLLRLLWSGRGAGSRIRLAGLRVITGTFEFISISTGRYRYSGQVEFGSTVAAYKSARRNLFHARGFRLA